MNVELTGILDSLSGQETMFWVASGSVALGVALILAAGLAQFRRLRNGRTVVKAADRAPEGKPAGLKAAPAPRATEPAGSRPDPSTAVMRPDIHDQRELRLLLARLRSAADKLEESRHPVVKMPVQPAESPLKQSGHGVDYVFRAGLG